MRNIIRKILKESEDDLEWARDIVSMPIIPKPDGNHYVLRFVRNTDPEVFTWVSQELNILGWRATYGQHALDYNLRQDLINYNRTSDNAYVSLKPKGTVSIGSSPYAFEEVNGYPMDSVINIWCSQ